MEHTTHTTDHHDHPPSGRNLRRAAVVAVLAVAAVGGLGGVARAALTSDSTGPVDVPPHDYLRFRDAGLAPELADELAAYLDERGVDYDLRVNECEMPELWLDPGDEQAQAAFDDFLLDYRPASPEQIAARNESTDAMAAYLDERGIPYRVTTEPDGDLTLHPDGDIEAFDNAVNDFMSELDTGPSAEEIAAIRDAANEEAAAMAAFLEERDIPYTDEQADQGYGPTRHVWPVLSDDPVEYDQAIAALEDFYSQPGTPWCGVWQPDTP